MKVGDVVNDLMGRFRKDQPIISVQTEIVVDNPDVYEVTVKLQKRPASFNNGDVEVIKNQYAFKEFGENKMVFIGVDMDNLPYLLFNFEDGD